MNARWQRTSHSGAKVTTPSEGASAPDALVDEAQRLSLRSLALTDRDGVYGIVRAHVQARALGVQVLIGVQVTIRDGSHLLLLAQEQRGYAQLCRLLTMGHGRAPKGQSTVTWEEVAAHAPGLLALWGGEGRVLTFQGQGFRRELSEEQAERDGKTARPRHTGLLCNISVGRREARSCQSAGYQWTEVVTKHLPHLSNPQATVLASWRVGRVLARSGARTAVSLF